MNYLCDNIIMSEDYADFVIEDKFINQFSLNIAEPYCIERGELFASLYTPLIYANPLKISDIPYSTIPKLYRTMDTTATSAVGSDSLTNFSSLNLTGDNVITAFIDTGIDYTHPAFRDEIGKTRIIGIWDQTISSSNKNNSPIDISYGSFFSSEDINNALSSDNPKQIVPTTDETGHGTAVCGICSGSSVPSDNFTGIATNSKILFVKLKTAKQYLLDFYMTDNNYNYYQETDILNAISFIDRFAAYVKLPIVLVFSLGTTNSSHSGNSPLERTLNQFSTNLYHMVCIPAGNEGDKNTHFSQTITSDNSYVDAEISNPDEGQNIFVELWGKTPEIFSVAIISPSGETIPRIPARIGQSETYSFLFDRTTVTVEYSVIETQSGDELILIKLNNASLGIWKIRVYGTNVLSGNFNIWISSSSKSSAYFLSPDPFITITSPGNALYPLTLGAYNHYTNSIYPPSGRGYTTSGYVKPELLSPGVDVFGPSRNGENKRYTGTSIASSVAGGVCAQLLEWSVVNRQIPVLTGISLKNYLIRGAIRFANEKYPSETLGYGLLNGFNSLIILRES